MTGCREDYRYNIEAVDLLISNQLVLMQQYDVHLAHSMENGMNYPAVVFAMQLVQRFCTDIDRLTVRAQEVCLNNNNNNNNNNDDDDDTTIYKVSYHVRVTIKAFIEFMRRDGLYKSFCFVFQLKLTKLM